MSSTPLEDPRYVRETEFAFMPFFEEVVEELAQDAADEHADRETKRGITRLWNER